VREAETLREGVREGVEVLEGGAEAVKVRVPEEDWLRDWLGEGVPVAEAHWEGEAEAVAQALGVAVPLGLKVCVLLVVEEQEIHLQEIIHLLED
jgi:hypothetical protein